MPRPYLEQNQPWSKTDIVADTVADSNHTASRSTMTVLPGRKPCFADYHTAASSLVGHSCSSYFFLSWCCPEGRADPQVTIEVLQRDYWSLV